MTDEQKKPPENMLKVAAHVRAVIERAQAAGEPITDEMIALAIGDAMFANLSQGGGLRPRPRPGPKH